MSNGFDKLARPYRLMEYLTFGPLLWQTRTTYLPEAGNRRHALVLGDGDGRFTAALLRTVPHLQVTAIDSSSAMLQQLTARASRQGSAARLTTHHANATTTLPNARFDLLCTHFFLDCLTDAQCTTLARRVADRALPSALWIVSDFAIPPGRLRWPARILVRALYAAFGLLTGLRVRHLPDYPAALREAGFQRVRAHTRLGGILRSELWVFGEGEPTEPGPASSNHP